MKNETCACGTEKTTETPKTPCCCGESCACEHCACRGCTCGERCACASCPCRE